jgi:ATP-dependent Lhr-like helicase
MPLPLDDLLGFVDRLEDLEARLLSWGISDPRIAHEELEGALAEAGVATERHKEAISELLRAHLLVREAADGGFVYRTRSAEIIRLAVRLRQWFGAQAGASRFAEESEEQSIDPEVAQTWSEAKSLVGDFRFRSTPRSRPKRDIQADSVLSDMEANGLQEYVQAVRALLDDRHLSGFQQRSLQSVLGASSRGDSGTVVTAGTGAGKTLAFYLPVLAALHSKRAGGRGPRVVAVYPRNELLKDQLQTALGECRRARSGLGGGARQLRIGALYGDVPNHWRDAREKSYRGWNDRRSEDLICPFLKCPDPGCSGKLRLQDEHRSSFSCTEEECSETVDGLEVAFTREALKKEAPDILFISAEMLDRSLRSKSLRRVIGLDGGRPEFVLLDEVHTYEGVSGAQCALTLQRWRSQVWSQGIHWVGLSATLSNPVDFFANLAPISPGRVTAVEPLADELEAVSRQYTLLLQSDASSQTALLSVTIQALMLLSRTAILPSNGRADRAEAVSEHRDVFGTRLFAFADKLDIIRRLADDYEDAELSGLPKLRTPQRQASPPVDPRIDERIRAGQSWDLALGLGFDLGKPTEQSELTSRNRGDVDGEVVIASSALEVGFDDPTVGLVLQHKAPRQWSSYVQRIGRAGRQIAMRPWAVTVLSEFGRDRSSFLSFEDFLNPVVRTRGLPTRNLHVLRMQAAASILDELASRVGGASLDYLHQYVCPQDKGRWAEELEKLANDVDELSRRLAKRLGLPQGSPLLQEVLWRPPRSLLLEFVPALRRQLHGGGTSEEKRAGPFHRFLPPAQFKSLNVPEVALSLQGQEKLEALPIERALRECALLNANMRFAGPGGRGHWLSPKGFDAVAPAPDDSIDVALQDLGSFYSEGTVPGPEHEGIEVYRPYRLYLRELPGRNSGAAHDKARGEYEWNTHYEEGYPGLAYGLPGQFGLSRLVHEVRLHTHAQANPLTCFRYATGSRATRTRLGREKTDEKFQFAFVKQTESGRTPVAIGYGIEVDAVVVGVQMKEQSVLDWEGIHPAEQRSLRQRFFGHLVELNDGGINGSFVCDDAVEAFHCMILDAGADSQKAVEDCIATLGVSETGFTARLERVLDHIFPQGEDGGHNSPAGKKLRAALADRDGLRSVLFECSTCLHEDLSAGRWRAEYQDWLRERSARALAGSFLSACQDLIEGFDESGVYADVKWDDEEDGRGSIYVSESEPGGIGLCSAIQDLLEEDMERLLSLWQAKLHVTPEERRDRDLSWIAAAIREQTEWGSLANRYREARSIEDQERSAVAIRERLVEAGVPASHGLYSALFSRLLAPGSSSELDEVIHQLLLLRQAREEVVGYELSARSVAFAGATNQPLLDAMSRFAPWSADPVDDPTVKYRRLLSLLWSRASDVRQSELDYYNPYDSRIGVDSVWVRSQMAALPTVNIDDESWIAQIEEALQISPQLKLVSPQGGFQRLAHAVRQLAVQEVSYQMLRVYLKTEAVECMEEGWSVTVAVPGVLG